MSDKNKQAQHPTPWQCEMRETLKHKYHYFVIIDNSGKDIFQSNFYSPNSLKLKNTHKVINRIAAAVNACAGIPDEALNQSPINKIVDWCVAEREKNRNQPDSDSEDK